MIGVTEILIVALVAIVPLAFLTGAFFVGYFVGKSAGRKQALHERGLM